MRRCTPCPCWILLQPCWVNRLVGIPYSSTVWGTFTILLFELCSHSSRFDHSVCINHTVFASFVRAWGREGGREGCFHWGHICICLNECRFLCFWCISEQSSIVIIYIGFATPWYSGMLAQLLAVQIVNPIGIRLAMSNGHRTYSLSY